MSALTKYSIAVIGLGKIGLPLAVQYASKGFQVFGLDINEEVVRSVNKGEPPFPGENELRSRLQQVRSEEKLVASTLVSDYVSKSNVVVVVVPLYVDHKGEPDFSSLDSATVEIGKGLKTGTLVCFETTLPIGTTRTRLTPILEKQSKLSSARDFFVVFSPERVLTGRVFADLRKYPKLVGGVGVEAEDRGYSFYSSVLDFDQRNDLYKPNGVWKMGGSDTAEMVKLVETTYRDVNIALANQFALFAEKNSINIQRVISSANSQPYSQIHQPGIAVGGHCIPIYPQLYLWTDKEAEIVKTARFINSSMPFRYIELLEKLHGNLKGQNVAVLGVSYRGDVKETAFSGIFPTVDCLKSKGAMVTVQDPLFSEEELLSLGFNPHLPGSQVDAIVVQADHESFRFLNKDYYPGVRTVLDGRNILNKKLWREVKFYRLGENAAE